MKTASAISTGAVFIPYLISCSPVENQKNRYSGIHFSMKLFL